MAFGHLAIGWERYPIFQRSLSRRLGFQNHRRVAGKGFCAQAARLGNGPHCMVT